ncbi:MAG: PLP-dependent aminotransferase family protein [Holophaga sp.]|nr:PLP-dependent aminotransferase family protein [Holophaga sp.]
MALLKASDIREILKVTQRAEVISFAGGLPAPEFFPWQRLAEVSRDLLLEDGPRALQYSTTEGHPPLREKLALRHNARWGTHHAAGDILITSGSQQGLDLVGKLFLDDGDTVLCESPTYLGTISAWTTFRPTWVEVATDDDGMDMAALETRLAQCGQVKLIYVIPNFQNPSGRTWSMERRRQFMAIINRHQIHVVEDNPYGELRFEGESLPNLESMDTQGLVIGLGTFSKVFCPGMRLAWMTAKAPLYEKLVILKQGTDLHTSTLHQMEVNRYLDHYDLDADIARILPVYRERRDAMLRALEAELPSDVRFTRPAGGLFIWVELPEGLNGRKLLAACLERNVAFVPGGAFYPNGGHENTFRLNYSNMPVERIQEGVRRLAGAIRELR